MEGGQSGTYLRLTRASSGLRVSVAKTYRDENEYFGQITVAFLSSRIQGTEAKSFKCRCGKGGMWGGGGGLTDIETGVVS